MGHWGPFSLHDKNAVVTGGAMGIGRGIAERLAEAGANVLIADMNGDTAKATADEITQKGGGRATALQLDCTDSCAGEEIVKACVGEFGSIDILVNNAGIYPQVPMLQMEEALWDKVMAINLKGLAFIAKAVAAKMIEQGKGGKIVNIASIDGLHPSMVGLAAYDASKGGVVMFTKNFALEMGPHHIQVNAIAPGGINTEGTAAPLEGSGMTEEEMKAMMDAFKARIPAGRMGVPDDIGKVAAFLASAGSDYMTGEIVVVDGGMLLS
ncbi:MAG: SDR family oxidoreductase [Coriobacteriia bacterium]|nr:SDR family oxidoreductase [Coriobacteriia bacterium]